MSSPEGGVNHRGVHLSNESPRAPIGVVVRLPGHHSLGPHRRPLGLGLRGGAGTEAGDSKTHPPSLTSLTCQPPPPNSGKGEEGLNHW